jgi:aryl-alcohol dehydrogenase-like predicted oxidoreductase
VEYRRLGKTHLQVSVIGMGTWQTFDTHLDRKSIVEEAIGAGINLFDTSPMYGLAQATLARALQGRRKDVLIADKVWADSEEEGREQSIYSLRLYERVDVYQVHNLVSWRSQLSLLESLKGEGRVTAIGATHYLPSAYEELSRVMRSGRLDMVQVPYNPLQREVERLILPLADQLGLGVFVHSPMRAGVLNIRPARHHLQTLGVESWPEAVLKWIASDRRVSSVLTATRTPGRPTSNAKAGSEPWFDGQQRRLVLRIASGEAR